MLRIRLLVRWLLFGVSWFGAVLSFAAEVNSTAADKSVIVFDQVHVLPMDSERILRNQRVLVQGDRIIALAPAGG